MECGSDAVSGGGERSSYPVHHMDNTFLRPTQVCHGSIRNPNKIAMIMLNSPSMTEDIVRRVWPHTSLRYCADGAANRLYECFEKGDKTKDVSDIDYLPDVILGDLDSLHSHVNEFYRDCGTRIERDEDQDTNDFDKCMQDLLSNPLLENCCQEWTVLVVGPFLGRLDQEMASYHSAYKWVDTFARVVLLSSTNWAEPLRIRHRHIISINSSTEGPHCGLLPLNGPGVGVHTQGLKWNLSGETLTMGTFVSTSNIIIGDVCGGDDCNVNVTHVTDSGCGDCTLKGIREEEVSSRVIIESSGGGCLMWVCPLRLET